MSILEAKNIVKKCGDRTLLDDISFSIEEKGVYAILGKKGSGKTALADVLAGCSDIESGELIFKNISVYSNSKNNCMAKLKIGYVSQEINFFSDMTVFEILDFAGKLRRVQADKRIRQIKEALDIVGLSDKYEVFIGELSSSEKKRLSLAHALIGNPSLIIFDEPTANIALGDADLISDVIMMLGDKKTVILLTDKVRLAQSVATNVGIISNGVLKIFEPIDVLKASYPGDDNFLVKTFSTFSCEN